MLTRPARTETVCLLTAFDTRYQAIADLTLPRMKALCTAQGYDFRPLQIDKPERPGGWIKIPPIRDALQKPFDWVLWLDTDVLVLRTDQDIRESFGSGGDLHMAWHEPGGDAFSEDMAAHFNSGVMAIRRCAWSQAFFTRVWDVGPLAHGWKDQAAILHLLGYDDVMELGPRRHNAADLVHVRNLGTAWNAIPGVATCDDPIAHHWAGIANFATRLRLMRLDAASIPFREAKPAAERAHLAALFHRLRHHAGRTDGIERDILLLDPGIGERLVR